MRTREETQALMDYLGDLKGLYDSGFQVSNEINRCVRELEQELRIQQWDRAKEYRIAAGTNISIVPGDGSELNIIGPSKLIVIPE